MKKAIFIIGAIALMSFVSEKFIVIKFKEEQINYHWQNLNTVKQIISVSDVPHKQAVFVLQSIDSLQKDIQKTATLDSLTTNKK